MKLTVCIKSPTGSTALPPASIGELEIKLYQHCSSFGHVRKVRALADARDHTRYDGQIMIDMSSTDQVKRLADSLQGVCVADAIVAKVFFEEDAGAPRPDALARHSGRVPADHP